jgi:hypothetical protein
VSNEQAAPETKGATEEFLATVGLGPEIEGMAGRQLRMRMVTIEPGGVFGPIHDHKDRPGIVVTVQVPGTGVSQLRPSADTRLGSAEATDLPVRPDGGVSRPAGLRVWARPDVVEGDRVQG